MNGPRRHPPGTWPGECQRSWRVQFDTFAQNGLTLKQLFDKDGSVVLIHTKEDDNKTDPTSDAGGRIACGVVEKS